MADSERRKRLQFEWVWGSIMEVDREVQAGQNGIDPAKFKLIIDPLITRLRDYKDPDEIISEVVRISLTKDAQHAAAVLVLFKFVQRAAEDKRSWVASFALPLVAFRCVSHLDNAARGIGPSSPSDSATMVDAMLSVMAITGRFRAAFRGRQFELAIEHALRTPLLKTCHWLRRDPEILAELEKVAKKIADRSTRSSRYFKVPVSERGAALVAEILMAKAQPVQPQAQPSAPARSL